jgi:hypothetical protein
VGKGIALFNRSSSKSRRRTGCKRPRDALSRILAAFRHDVKNPGFRFKADRSLDDRPTGAPFRLVAIKFDADFRQPLDIDGIVNHSFFQAAPDAARSPLECIDLQLASGAIKFSE